ncbi:MAG: hypothetical protein OEW12_01905 [Deltaproteobacteria bacterium]|nr:hypothetical protein [Deltaproteobacteria bacterium]
MEKKEKSTPKPLQFLKNQSKIANCWLNPTGKSPVQGPNPRVDPNTISSKKAHRFLRRPVGGPSPDTERLGQVRSKENQGAQQQDFPPFRRPLKKKVALGYIPW